MRPVAPVMSTVGFFSKPLHPGPDVREAAPSFGTKQSPGSVGVPHSQPHGQAAVSQRLPPHVSSPGTLAAVHVRSSAMNAMTIFFLGWLETRREVSSGVPRGEAE